MEKSTDKISINFANRQVTAKFSKCRNTGGCKPYASLSKIIIAPRGFGGLDCLCNHLKIGV